MNSQRGEIFPIDQKEIIAMRKTIAPYLSNIVWTPQGGGTAKKFSAQTALIDQAMTGKVAGGAQKLNLIKEMMRLSDDPNLMSEHSNKVANTIIYAFSLGWAVANQYAKSSGLEDLRSRNTQSEKLDNSQQAELGQKLNTEAAITLFTAAYYIVQELSSYQVDLVKDRVSVPVELLELTLLRKEKALQCSLYYFGTYVSMPDIVTDDIALVRMAIDYFRAVLNEIDLRKSSFQYKETFEGRSYRVEKPEFTFRGFDSKIAEQRIEVKVKPTMLSEMVGNQVPKKDLWRDSERLLTYDLATQRNPIVELGGMIRTTGYFGTPGTGKTMCSRIMVTILDERTKDLKMPFRPNPLRLDVIDTFQGGSVPRMMEWFAVQNDLTQLIFSWVDDAEGVLSSRESGDFSEGSGGVHKVYLNELDGTTTDYRGQNMIWIMSNEWQVISPPAMSRIGKKVFIRGAETIYDYMDQAYLWFSGLEQQEPGLVDLAKPADYTYLEKQKMITTFAEFNKERDTEPKHPVLKEMYGKLKQKWNPEKDPEFLGQLSVEIQNRFPGAWGSRELSNVQKGVAARLMDFDYDADWRNDHAKFFALTYDQKFKKLLELRKAAMNGLSFGRILLQEFITYADTAVLISNTSFEKAVAAEMNRQKIYHEAMSRLSAQNANGSSVVVQ